MSMRRVLAAATLAATASAVAVGGPVAASTAGHIPRLGGIGIRLMQVPVSERADPRARLYIIDHVPPGAVIRRRIQLVSTSGTTARLQVYPAAAAISHGRFLFAAGQTQNLMTTWVHLSRPALTLAPHGSATDTVIIRVPRDAPPGEQYGVIWAQVHGRNPANASISLVSRVGIRIYLSVGPGNPPASNFTATVPGGRRGSDGRAIVSLTVHNTGGRALDMSGALTLAAIPESLRAGPFLLTTAATLAPGQAAPVTFTLQPGIPNGPWQAVVKLRSGLITRIERATISFSTIRSTADSISVLPVAAGLTALLLLLATAGVIIIRTRRPASQRA